MERLLDDKIDGCQLLFPQLHTAISGSYLGDNAEVWLKLQYNIRVDLQSGVLVAHLWYATQNVALVSVDVLTARSIHI